MSSRSAPPHPSHPALDRRTIRRRRPRPARPGHQLNLFEDREQHVIETAARRLRRADKDEPAEAFAVFNAAQDHVIRCGRVHIDRVVLEAFTAGIARCDDPDAQSCCVTSARCTRCRSSRKTSPGSWATTGCPTSGPRP
ncbi:hypothetical protein [Aeromicrobium sp. UC242_57]|uniref:hypothetical protein n=1 Tax=Aeromicrobium sp. UC242_57 TaxID=3374624 RepID=UPI0037BFA4DA